MKANLFALAAVGALALLDGGRADGQQPAAPQSASITIDNLRAELNKAIAGLATEDQLNAAIRDVTDLVRAQDAELKKLRKELTEQQALLADQIASQDQILKAISEQDTQGNRILALNHNMEVSPDFRREMANAMQNSMPQWGKLIITNQMGTPQNLIVNGRGWSIPASSTPVVIQVPAGTATTELVGFEAPKNWAIGAPNFQQSIVIGTGFSDDQGAQLLGPLVPVRR